MVGDPGEACQGRAYWVNLLRHTSLLGRQRRSTWLAHARPDLRICSPRLRLSSPTRVRLASLAPSSLLCPATCPRTKGQIDPLPAAVRPAWGPSGNVVSFKTSDFPTDSEDRRHASSLDRLGNHLVRARVHPDQDVHGGLGRRRLVQPAPRQV